MEKWSNLRNTVAGMVFLLGMAGFCAACDDDDAVTNPYLTIESEQTVFEGSADKAEYIVTIRSNCNWQVVERSEGTGWVRAFPDEGEKEGKFKFIVKGNEQFVSREAEFAIVADGQEYPVLLRVTQQASVPAITIGDGSGTVNVASAGGQTAVTSKANVRWTCRVDEAAATWMKLDSISEAGMIYLSMEKNNGPAREGILHCESEEEPSANVDVKVVQAAGSIILQEDFGWLAYGSTTHWDTTGETAYNKWTADELAHGWTSSSEPSPCLYARTGFVKIGKTNYAGDLISPKLALTGKVDVKVTFKACAYISKGGTKDNNELYIHVLGAGTADVQNPLIIDNYPNSSNMENGADYDVWAPEIAERSFIIRGATSETQIKFMGGDSYDLNGRPGTENRNRIFLDDITVTILE